MFCLLLLPGCSIATYNFAEDFNWTKPCLTLTPEEVIIHEY